MDPYAEPHDISPAWTPREYLDYEGAAPAPLERRTFAPQHQAFREYAGYAPSAVYRGPERVPQPPRHLAASERMSKVEALELLRACKKALVVTSLVAFGVLSALVASHAAGSSTGASSSSSGDSSSQSAPAQPADPFHSDDPSNSGGFFHHHDGGYSFGSGGSGQAPATGSSVS